jgi:hypothetical protein
MRRWLCTSVGRIVNPSKQRESGFRETTGHPFQGRINNPSYAAATMVALLVLAGGEIALGCGGRGGGNSAGGGTLLTGPGSQFYDAMAQQQMQQAYFQQLLLQAQKRAARREQHMAAAKSLRAEVLARRQRNRERLAAKMQSPQVGALDRPVH